MGRLNLYETFSRQLHKMNFWLGAVLPHSR
jgi:hypothetical protein